MKKICMIGAYPPPINGMSVAIECLSEAQSLKDQFSIYKVDFAVKNQLTGLREILYKIYFNIDHMFQFKKLIANSNFDIFYLNMSTSNRGSNRDILLTNIIQKYAPCAKLVLHHHGGSFQSFYEGCSKWRKRRVKAYLDAADIVIALTETLSYMFKGVVDNAKMRIVSNCVKDSERLSSEQIDKKLTLIIQKEFFNFVYLSNMIKSKGYMIVLETAKALKENNEKYKVKFIFAGAFRSDRDKNEFEEYIRQNQLEGIVEYRGVVQGEEKVHLLFQGDVFILPTKYPLEGQPISILEAMAAGMPIITTDQGGISDIVKDGINGKVLKEVTASCVASAILSLINNKNLMQRMGKNNIDEVNEKYLEKYYVKNMISIFQKVINDEK